MKIITFFFLSVLLFAGCSSKDTSSGETVEESTEQSAEETKPEAFVRFIDVPFAKGLIASNKNLMLIDVRTPEENAEGGIDNSSVVDVESDDFEEKIAEFPRDTTYLVYCRSGKRSTRAVNKMSEMGFTRLYMLKGGFLAWEEE